MRAKAIMIQGTMSNAGKSLLAAGLCRIFKQDGYRVAPFKSQNMALNSYITDDGLEMGRAQAVQAEAAGVRPSADMNPVLLKPTGDTGSQVIVCGIPIGTMPAREYFAYKKKLIPEIRAAYERLASQYDIIVIEGAGSPAEINLKQDDIVNMGMAKMADAPVLLAGDIDRGGVFAQLYGTVALLEPEERARIKGLIVNKFRGDKTILEPGIRMLEELCGVPVAGVVPYMHVDIEDEDSLSERLLSAPRRGEAGEKKTPPAVRIAVIRFPRLSNFTDFQVLSILDDVEVSYVSSVKELGEPDLVILPGTKNTMEDLLWLRQSGLEAAVLKLAGHQTPVVGICGGYQRLGETLRDPEGTENGTGEPAVLRGMGLLPMETVFHSEKTRTRVSGVFGDLSGPLKPLSGMELEGYEIHMGESRRLGAPVSGGGNPAGERPAPGGGGMETRPSVRIGGNHGPLTHIKEQQSQSMVEKSDGFWHNYIYGTYIHGIFDGAGIARALADSLRAAKGLEPKGTEKEPDYRAYREQQYDALAGALREHLDMEMVYKILRQEETT